MTNCLENIMRCKMGQKLAKIILIFGLCFLLINCLGYIFKIPEFVTIMNNPTGGGGRSTSNIPTIFSLLITCVILLVIRIKNKK